MRFLAHATVLGYSAGDLFDIDDDDQVALAEVEPYLLGEHVTTVEDAPDEPTLPDLAVLAALTLDDDERRAALVAAVEGLDGAGLKTLAEYAGVAKGGKLDDVRARLVDHYAEVDEAPGE